MAGRSVAAQPSAWQAKTPLTTVSGVVLACQPNRCAAGPDAAAGLIVRMRVPPSRLCDMSTVYRADPVRTIQSAGNGGIGSTGGTTAPLGAGGRVRRGPRAGGRVRQRRLFRGPGPASPPRRHFRRVFRGERRILLSLSPLVGLKRCLPVQYLLFTTSRRGGVVRRRGRGASLVCRPKGWPDAPIGCQPSRSSRYALYRVTNPASWAPPRSILETLLGCTPSTPATVCSDRPRCLRNGRRSSTSATCGG
jgi:hypothetical protein